MKRNVDYDLDIRKLTHPLIADIVVVADGFVFLVSGGRALRAVAAAEGFVATAVVIATFEVRVVDDEVAILIATIALRRTVEKHAWQFYKEGNKESDKMISRNL